VNFICVRLYAVGNYYAIDCLHPTLSYPNETSKECIQFLNEEFFSDEHLVM
jgi:hypothetical protein